MAEVPHSFMFSLAITLTGEWLDHWLSQTWGSVPTRHRAFWRQKGVLAENPLSCLAFSPFRSRVVGVRISSGTTLTVMVMFRFDGQELKRRRRSAGLTVGELARQVGRSHASLTHYESGFTVPSTSALLRMCSVLGVKPGALFSPVLERERAMS